jgi:hypothetical protein
MTISVSRPDGSTHFLRFTGSIATGDADPGGYGQFPGPFAAGTHTVKFLMGLASTYVQPAGSDGPLDPQYRLPNFAYDDAVAGAPHATVKDRIWAQNSRVFARALDANISAIELNASEWEIDATTGLPVLLLDITVSAENPEVDIQVEITHSTIR